MKGMIIGYKSKRIDAIYSRIAREKIKLQRLNLYISDQVRIELQSNTKIMELDLRNFHDLTIELTNFQPDFILYYPIGKLGDFSRNDQDIEIIFLEMVDHLLEIVKMLNSKFILLIPDMSKLKMGKEGLTNPYYHELMEESCLKVQNYTNAKVVNEEENNLDDIVKIILQGN